MSIWVYSSAWHLCNNINLIMIRAFAIELIHWHLLVPVRYAITQSCLFHWLIYPNCIVMRCRSLWFITWLNHIIMYRYSLSWLLLVSWFFIPNLMSCWSLWFLQWSHHPIMQWYLCRWLLLCCRFYRFHHSMCSRTMVSGRCDQCDMWWTVSSWLLLCVAGDITDGCGVSEWQYIITKCNIHIGLVTHLSAACTPCIVLSYYCSYVVSQ